MTDLFDFTQEDSAANPKDDHIVGEMRNLIQALKNTTTPIMCLITQPSLMMSTTV